MRIKMFALNSMEKKCMNKKWLASARRTVCFRALFDEYFSREKETATHF